MFRPGSPLFAGPQNVEQGLPMTHQPDSASHRICVAPMMAWTDRHCRWFHRQLSARARLYTEMVTAAAICHGDTERLLRFDAVEHPVALQIGGADPDQLARAARIGRDFGYDEINLNVGCPSDRVRSGRFGACLMAEPALVAEGVAAMCEAVDIPVTVKCRIAIDDQDGEASLDRFVGAVAGAGCGTVIVHARKAWLEGLSPDDNRTVPPLDHGRVHRLKRDWPDLTVILNGGVATLDEGQAHLAHVDGVMLGRAAYRTPWLLSGIDQRIFGNDAGPLSRLDVVDRLVGYAGREVARGTRLNHITRHIFGLFAGEPGARLWRRYLSENANSDGAGPQVLREARAMMEAIGERALAGSRAA